MSYTTLGSVQNGTGGCVANNATGRVFTLGNYAYWTCVDVSGKPAIQIWRISNPAIPVFLSHIVIGDSGYIGNAINDLFVVGNSLYVTIEVANGGVGGAFGAFVIIDVSSKTSPSVVAIYTSASMGGTITGLDNPTCLKVKGSYAYIGCYTGRLLILDISNPLSVYVKGYFDCNPNIVGSCFYQTNYIILCTMGTGFIEIINISNPAAPFRDGQHAPGYYDRWASNFRCCFSMGTFLYGVCNWVYGGRVLWGLDISDIHNIPALSGAVTSGGNPSCSIYSVGDNVLGNIFYVIGWSDTEASDIITNINGGYGYLNHNTIIPIFSGVGTDIKYNSHDFMVFLMSNGIMLYGNPVSPSLTVSYNGNGSMGGVTPDPVSYYGGETITVSGNTGSLTRTGYSFNDWNTAADGSGDSYSGGDTFILGDSSVVLYAQWVRLPSILYVNASGSSTYPYDTPEKGATNFGELIEGIGLSDGDIVNVVNDGIIDNSNFDEIIVNAAVTIQSYSGNDSKPTIKVKNDSGLFLVTNAVSSYFGKLKMIKDGPYSTGNFINFVNGVEDSAVVFECETGYSDSTGCSDVSVYVAGSTFSTLLDIRGNSFKTFRGIVIEGAPA